MQKIGDREPRRAPRFELTAGNLCLNFINTLDDRPSGKPKELLQRYVDLGRFAEDARILTASEVDRIFSFSQGAPEEAQRVLHDAVQLREAMYAIFAAVVKKHTVPKGPLVTLNGFIQHAAQHASLAPGNGRFIWKFDNYGNSAGGLDAMLWPIVRSAADLLASDHLPFVRECSSQSCKWFFLDTSKNHRRRWCSMKLCGNRAKVRRFYAKGKAD